VDDVRKRQELAVAALVRTHVDPKRRAYRALDRELRSLGAPVADTAIPLRSAFHDAGVVGLPVALGAPWSPGGVAYFKLGEELGARRAEKAAA